MSFWELLACLSLVLSPNCTFRQCRIERSHPKQRSSKIEEPDSPQASSPDIRQTEIHRPRPLRASFHGHEKWKGALPNGDMAGSAGNKSVPRFHQKSVRAHHTALTFLCFSKAIKRDDVLTALSVSRSEQRTEQAQTETQTKKIPHTRLPISLRTFASTRREGRCVVRVCHFSGEDGRRPSLPVSGNLGAVRTWELALRRRPIYFPFSLLAGSTVHGPGVRANRERKSNFSPRGEELVYYNWKVDSYYYGDEIIKMPQNRQKQSSSEKVLGDHDNRLPASRPKLGQPGVLSSSGAAEVSLSEYVVSRVHSLPKRLPTRCLRTPE